MGVEPFASCIDCGERDAVVKCKAAHPDVSDAALAQTPRQPRLRLVVGRTEGGVAVDVEFPALSKDEVGLHRVDALDGSTVGAFNAVNGPEHLHAVWKFNDVEHVPAFMVPGKGDVTRRMPVLGHDDAVPGILFEHFTDDGHDLVAAGYRQRAPGQKILLQVDDGQGVLS